MSLSAHSPADANAETNEEPTKTATKEERLTRFLRSKAASGDYYFKSKFIADEVGLSPKEIGAIMVKLQDAATDIQIEKWSYTSATTWRVVPA